MDSSNESLAIEFLSKAVARYKSNIDSINGMAIEESIVNYLAIIPAYPYITHIIIAQEPYRPELLPKISSAFAWDYTNKDITIPPSVTTTAQFICNTGNSSDQQYLAPIISLLTCSYLLIREGVIFLNVHCASTYQACPRVRMASYFCEMIIDIIYASRLIGIDRMEVHVHAFGDVATRAIQSIRAGLDKKLTKGMILTVYIRTCDYY